MKINYEKVFKVHFILQGIFLLHFLLNSKEIRNIFLNYFIELNFVFVCKYRILQSIFHLLPDMLHI